MTNENKAWVERSKTDPNWWIEHYLGVTLWDKQKEIAQAVHDFPRVSVRSCSGSGKSFDAACIALWFLYLHPPATVITTAPTWRQVEQILWREIAGRIVNSRIHLDGRLTGTRLELDENWFALGISTDEPEKFQGFHNKNILVVGDEASGLSEQVYTAIENPLSTGNAKLLLIGNPTQSVGKFRDTFTSPIYKSFHISAFDTPNLAGITLEDIKNNTWKDKVKNPLPYPSLTTPQWVAERFTEWGEGSFLFQVYVMGNFPDAGVNNLIKLSDIDKCVNQGFKEEGSKALSVDVSRYGDDETVVILGTNNKVILCESWGHQDTVYTAGRVARMIRQYSPHVVKIDSVGVGAGVVDLLRSEGYDIQEFNAGLPAIDTEQYLNKRAELYWLLSKRLEKGEIDIPDNAKLKAQLADVQYTYNKKGQLIIESKEDMRKRGSRSPDWADALMMLMGNTRLTSTSNKIKVRVY